MSIIWLDCRRRAAEDRERRQHDTQPDAEINQRRDLAVVCRLNGNFQPDDSIFINISARAPTSEGDGAFLINPCGLRSDEVTAGNLVTVNPERRIYATSITVCCLSARPWVRV